MQTKRQVKNCMSIKYNPCGQHHLAQLNHLLYVLMNLPTTIEFRHTNFIIPVQEKGD